MQAKSIISVDEFKRRARALRASLKNQGIEITYMQALHRIAKENHSRSWEMLEAKFTHFNQAISLGLNDVQETAIQIYSSGTEPISTESKFGQVALKTVEFAQLGMHPARAWDLCAIDIFPNSLSSQRKACPKAAFLGLAGAGLIIGIEPGEYTRSQRNKNYALTGYKILRSNDAYAANPKALWKIVMDLEGMMKVHNNQMNVLTALWQAKKLLLQNSLSQAI